MPLRLAILGSSPCDRCVAACCKQNGHEFSVLLEESEYRRFAPWSMSIAIDTGQSRVIERVLPYRDGHCIFLDNDDRCTIYEDRPRSCRRFECVRGYHPQHEHSVFLKRNPQVRKLLDEL